MDINMHLPSGLDVGWFPEYEEDPFEPDDDFKIHRQSKTVYVSRSKGCKWVWPVLR